MVIFEKMKRRWIMWRDKSYRSQYSGKETKRVLTVQKYGETRTLCQNVNRDGTVPYTADEIEAMVIACVACGQAIWPMDPICQLVPANEETFKPPKGAYFYKAEKTWLGCLGWECTHGDRTGFWIPDEKNPLQCMVLRVASPIELALASPHEGYINGNLADISTAVKETKAYLQSQNRQAEA